MGPEDRGGPAAGAEAGGAREAPVGLAGAAGARAETGAVTAETAVVLPLLAVVALSLAWLVVLGVTQVRALDAAREVARSAARSDGRGPALALGHRVAPAGSTVQLTVGQDQVVARVTSPVGPPLGLLGSWARVDLHAEAVAAREPGS